jgi:WD40 repeat protein
VVFILGPEHPTADWHYGGAHRQGVVVDCARPGHAVPLDARDIMPPFTAGALRGGTHVHVYSGEGDWISFTYDDCVLNDQRNVGVSVPVRGVVVPKHHPRNHDGSAFSVLVTHTTSEPCPGSDEISLAFEDAWVGAHGYIRPDGTRQLRAIAFQGQVVTSTGEKICEAFLVDLPNDVTQAGDAPLEGTSTTRPAPPHGTRQRRLSHTEGRKYPGLQGPRHWLRSSPDGTQIALLMRDEDGVVQLWTVFPHGGEPRQITQHPFNVASAFSWSPDGESIAYVADDSVFVTRVSTHESIRVTPRLESASAPRPEACVFSPDGRSIAFVRPVPHRGTTWNQVFVATTDSS